jgi:hypothetical protein
MPNPFILLRLSPLLPLINPQGNSQRLATAATKYTDKLLEVNPKPPFTMKISMAAAAMAFLAEVAVSFPLQPAELQQHPEVCWRACFGERPRCPRDFVCNPCLCAFFLSSFFFFLPFSLLFLVLKSGY